MKGISMALEAWPEAASEGGIGQSASTAELERMVREAGWSGIYMQWVSPTERQSMTVPVTPEQVAKFAELVAEAEREACAKTARKVPDVSEDYARSEAYVKIDHFLRDALDAVDYAEYSAALDLIFK